MVSSPFLFRLLGILSAAASLGMAILTALALGSGPERTWTSYLLAGLGSLGTMVGIQGAIFLFRRNRSSAAAPVSETQEELRARLESLQAHNQGRFSFTQAVTALGLTPTETEKLLHTFLTQGHLKKIAQDRRPYYSFSPEEFHE